MKKKFVFLLEEPSMKEFLVQFLPRLIDNDLEWLCLAHQGKSDLEDSIVRKLRGWNEPGVHFIILRDQDSGNCKVIKEQLQALCERGGKPATVRIVCRELESWFMGNLKAVGLAFSAERVAKLQLKEKFRDPDRLINAAREFKNLIPEYQKLSGARLMGRHIDPDESLSKSFNVFVRTIRELAG